MHIHRRMALIVSMTLLLGLVLFGCNPSVESKVFSGQSKHWKVQFEVKSKGDGTETGNGRYEIRYIGSNHPSQFRFEFEAAGHHSRGNYELNRPNEVVAVRSTYDFYSFEDVNFLTAVIKWNDMEERVVLKAN